MTKSMAYVGVVVLVVGLLLTTCVDSASAGGKVATASGLQTLTADELIDVSGQWTVRENMVCIGAVWYPCGKGTSGCYKDSKRNKCVNDFYVSVASCQGPAEDYDCRINPNPPFSCCIFVRIYSLVGGECPQDEEGGCTGELESFGWDGCDYQRCESVAH